VGSREAVIARPTVRYWNRGGGPNHHDPVCRSSALHAVALLLLQSGELSADGLLPRSSGEAKIREKKQ
jgi:hypothetical protein